MGNFKEDIAKIRAFVFDVDGVLTDEGIIPLANGDFIRRYNAKDGYALAYALKQGYKIAIITGGRGEILEHRFSLLGVTAFFSNCMDKLPVLRGFMEDHALLPHEVIFMGDDIPDIEAMQYTDMPVCPANAAMEVMAISRYVSQFDGGQGCARDIIEQVLRSRNDWAKDSIGAYGIPTQ